MPNKNIYYSDKYFDEKFEYRQDTDSRFSVIYLFTFNGGWKSNI